VPGLNDAFEDATTRKSVVKRQNLRGTEICSAVRGEIAIDAKNGDISVGGIGTYFEAYHFTQIDKTVSVYVRITPMVVAFSASILCIAFVCCASLPRVQQIAFDI
jgi:hypothetical protein